MFFLCFKWNNGGFHYLNVDFIHENKQKNFLKQK